MSSVERYFLAVQGIVAALRTLGMTVITRKDVSTAWAVLGSIAENDEGLPGHNMTDAMEQVAVALGGTFTYDGTDGRGRVNPRIVF